MKNCNCCSINCNWLGDENCVFVDIDCELVVYLSWIDIEFQILRRKNNLFNSSFLLTSLCNLFISSYDLKYRRGSSLLPDFRRSARLPSNWKNDNMITDDDEDDLWKLVMMITRSARLPSNWIQTLSCHLAKISNTPSQKVVVGMTLIGWWGFAPVTFPPGGDVLGGDMSWCK